MSERYDLARMLREIKKDEQAGDSRKEKASQDKIEDMLRQKKHRKRRDNDAGHGSSTDS